VRQEKREVSVHIPIPFIPPCEPYKVWIVEHEAFGKVRVFIRLSRRGGWVAIVKFPQEAITFNPVLRREAMEKLKKPQK